MNLLIVAVATVVLCVPHCVYAQEEANKSRQSSFIDLDGDGINDNATDLNDDGIPDSFGETTEPEMDTTIVSAPIMSFGDVGGELDMEAETIAVEVHEPNSVEFNALYSSLTDLCAQRGGLISGEGFGPENSVSGSGGGVICEGGVCRPK